MDGLSGLGLSLLLKVRTSDASCWVSPTMTTRCARITSHFHEVVADNEVSPHLIDGVSVPLALKQRIRLKKK